MELRVEPQGGRRAAPPERRCVVTRAALPRTAMIRFVVGPDGTLVPDVEGKLPGRGHWVTAERDTLVRAVAKGMLARAASRAVEGPVRVPADLVDRVERRLVERCLDLVGLARRAGQAVAGFEKVRAWLKEGRAALLLAASDGAADGRAKLAALAGGLPIVDLFDAASLGAALGRDMAVHGALAPGGLADRLIEEAGRLQAVRGTGTRGDEGSPPAGRAGAE